MIFTREIVKVAAVLAMTAAGVALAETIPGDHSMEQDHIQHAMPSGQHPPAGSAMVPSADLAGAFGADGGAP